MSGDFLERLKAEKARDKALNPDRYYDFVPIDDVLCCACNQPPWYDGAWWEDLPHLNPETLEIECHNCGTEIRLALDWAPKVIGQKLAEEDGL